MRAAAANHLRPASPSNIFTTAFASLTAVIREATYAQFTPVHSRFVKLPPVGTIMLVVAYVAWVLFLEFVNNNVEGAQHFTSLGVRAAWLGVAQVPLLILLAGKNNLIGAVTGVGYERLQILHRWTARILLFLVTLHVIFLHLSWNAYDLGPLEYATDSCIPTGWAVYAILIATNLSTIAPIRNFSYEFFVIQHILLFFGFIIAVMMHIPSTALYSRVYIYIPIALYLLDRLIRAAYFTYHNIRPGHATLTALEGGVTRITLKSPAIKNWTPGSHVLLKIPKLGLLQSHPATLASIPSSHNGDLVFLLKSHKGFTSRIYKNAAQSASSTHLALIDGPYRPSHADFAGFDTAFLIAGSTGITYTLPILLDIASRIQTQKLPVKRITFLWIIKNTSWVNWISKDLGAAAEKLRAAGIELDVRVHVTCDDDFTTGCDDDGLRYACGCEKGNGPCCCITVDEPTSSSSSINEKGTAVKITSSSSTTSLNSSNNTGVKSSKLPCATFYSGRPDIYSLLWDRLERAEGETGVCVCGPIGLSIDVRKSVVRCSDERAVHKGTGAQGIYLHSEGFGW